MDEEKNRDERPVLAVYDIRGIQDYIFRTNRIKEIVGASRIVEDALNEALHGWFTEHDPSGKTFVEQWKDENGARPFRFLQDPKVQAETLYYGGGNLFVAFRNNALAIDANRYIAERILNQTHTLNLASATVYMDESHGGYARNHKALLERLGRVKSEGRTVRCVGGFPFTKEELGSGLPTVAYGDKTRGEPSSARYSTETLLKINKYRKVQESNPTRECVDMDALTRKDKGDSYVAIVHIDGNNMGARIENRLNGIADYAEAVFIMRELSVQITDAFNRYAFEAITQYLDANDITTESDRRWPFRKIICAGDDVTFICRADLALTLTRLYLEAVSERAMCRVSSAKDAPYDIQNYGFSACAGIVYTHSHFPFSVAYEMAEALCASAKQRAKAAANLVRSAVGNFIDFHICYSGIIQSLKEIRRREYVNHEGDTLLLRPYRVGKGNAGEPFSLTYLETTTRRLNQSVPRSWIKRGRDAYHESREAIAQVFGEAASKENRSLGETPDADPFVAVEGAQTALYYDAMELYDIMQWMIQQGRETNEAKA